MITGSDLINMGHRPGPQFKQALEILKMVPHANLKQIHDLMKTLEPTRVKMKDLSAPCKVAVDSGRRGDVENLHKVGKQLEAALKTPYAVMGMIMPDACPSGPDSIPVGTVVATKGTIHPGFHSADIACSMFMTVMSEDTNTEKLLDRAASMTHFGRGRNTSRFYESYYFNEVTADNLFNRNEDVISGNEFVKISRSVLRDQLGTQGDGNHFLFIGRRRSDNKVCMITHHGSRGLGAAVFKEGMSAAIRYTENICPECPPAYSWLEQGTREYSNYMEALRFTKEWTEVNHRILHDSICFPFSISESEEVFNTHNFVYQGDNGINIHAKGATPLYNFRRESRSGLRIIPLNMSEPVLIVKKDNPSLFDFAPHGAGRNMSRSDFIKSLPESEEDRVHLFENETEGIDVRFFLGAPDYSEMPGAYKSAEKVKEDIKRFDLCDIVDEVDPIGCIMAGRLINLQTNKQ